MRLFRPRSSLGLAGRFLVLTIVVIGAVAATTAVAGLLQVQNLANDFGDPHGDQVQARSRFRPPAPRRRSC